VIVIVKRRQLQASTQNRSNPLDIEKSWGESECLKRNTFEANNLMLSYRKPWRLFFSIFKEALPFTAISFFILTTLVFVQQVGKYSGIILSFQASTQITLRFLLSLIPGIIIITLPVALLLGTVMACSRLSTDGELTAAQSLGISKINLALPFLTLGLLGALFTFHLSSQVAPKALKQLKNLRAKILLEEASTQIRPRVFITSFPNVLLHVQDVDPRTGDWLGVFILQQDPSRGISRLLTSERGLLRITTAPRITLEAQLYRGVSLENRTDPAQNTQPAAISNQAANSQAASDFEKLSIKLTEKGADNGEAIDASSDFSLMTLTEVARAAKGAPEAKARLRARVEWHKRLALSLACLTLTCVTFIFALRGKRFSTRPRTVVMILFVAMAFYLVLVAGQNLALSGSLPAWLGVWLSNILLSIYIFKSFISNKQFFPVSALTGIFPAPGNRSQRLQETAQKSSSEEDKKGESQQSKPSGFSLINLINYLIVSEVTKYYLLALLALVVTSVVFTLFDLIPAMAKSGTSVGYTTSYLLYLAPQLAYYVSPFAMLVAILTGCSVLARTNQFVILACAGQGKWRITTAILITAFSLGFGLWLFSDYLLPFTNREQDIRYHKIKNRQLEQTTIAFGKKWVLGKNNIIYSYQRIDGDNSLVNTSMFHLSPSNGVIERATHFGKATQLSANTWQAAEGWIDTIKPNLTIERMPLQTDNQTVRIEDGSSLFKRTVNESSKMSSNELNDYISQLKGIGIGTTELQLDLRKRIAFPFSCLTLALLAIPFANIRRARRSSPMISIALGVGISLVFWLLMTLFEAAGKQSSLPVSMAVWGPQILLLAMGMYLNFRYRSH
jgi:LPS export ABC transporter permease LptG